MITAKLSAPAGRRLAAGTLLACSVLIPHSGLAKEPGPPATSAKITDAVLVRPLALPFALAGTGVYLGTLPLTFLIDTDEPAADLLVRRPWWFTAGRPLGRFYTAAPR